MKKSMLILVLALALTLTGCSILPEDSPIILEGSPIETSEALAETESKTPSSEEESEEETSEEETSEEETTEEEPEEEEPAEPEPAEDGMAIYEGRTVERWARSSDWADNVLDAEHPTAELRVVVDADRTDAAFVWSRQVEGLGGKEEGPPASTTETLDETGPVLIVSEPGTYVCTVTDPNETDRELRTVEVRFWVYRSEGEETGESEISDEYWSWNSVAVHPEGLKFHEYDEVKHVPTQAGGSVTLTAVAKTKDGPCELEGQWYRVTQDIGADGTLETVCEPVEGETGMTLTVNGVDRSCQYFWSYKATVTSTGPGGSSYSYTREYNAYFYVECENGVRADLERTGGVALREYRRPYDATITLLCEPGEPLELTAIGSSDSEGSLTYGWSGYFIADGPAYAYGPDSDAAYHEEPIDPVRGSTLSIPSVDDRGELVCTVLDEYGNQFALSVSIVLENDLSVLPENAVGGRKYVDIDASGGGSFTLRAVPEARRTDRLEYEWTVTYDGGSRQWLVGGESPELTVSGLVKNATYCCIAYDGYGNSDSAYFNLNIDGGAGGVMRGSDIYLDRDGDGAVTAADAADLLHAGQPADAASALLRSVGRSGFMEASDAPATDGEAMETVIQDWGPNPGLTPWWRSGHGMPMTGDESPVMLWAAALLLCCAGLPAAVWADRKRRE